MKYRLLLFAILTECVAQEIYMMSSEWSRWSPWSFCSGGVRVRVRACATVRGFKCIGHNKEFQSCDLATTTFAPEGKSIDDPFQEDRSAAMKQLYPDYDQPFKPQAAKVTTTEAPFFKNNQLLEKLRESDSLAALINRAATVSPSSSPSPSTRSSPPPPSLASSQEEYEDEEIEEETTVPPTPTPTTTVAPTTRVLPEIRVATVTSKPGLRVTAQLQRKRPTEVPSTTVAPKREKEGLESLEHYEDGEIEEGSEYEEPSEGDEGGEKREEKDGKKEERNNVVAAASKIITERQRVETQEEQEEAETRPRSNKPLRHKVDGGDDDLALSSPVMKRKDLQRQSSQINHIPVVMPSADPFEDKLNGIHSKLLGVEGEMRDADKKSRRDLELTLKEVNGIIGKLEYEARFRATQGSGLSPLQRAYLKRSRDIRNQLATLVERKRDLPTTTTTTTTTTLSPSSTPPEPLNPKIAEDTVRALDWLMENIKDRLEPEETTTARPPKAHRHRTSRPSYMKGVRFIENGEEIHPHPIRLRTHSIPSQRSFRLPSSSIRTFGSVDGKTEEDEKEVESLPLPIPTQPVTIATTSRPRPVTVLPIPAGIEPILGTDWQPFEWSDWSDWSECVCAWQLRKRICIPNSEEVLCPAPEYQRRKCEGGTCKQKALLH